MAAGWLAAIGGILGGLGSMGASGQQAAGGKRALAQQQAQWATTQQELQPWLGAGQNALLALQEYMGMPGYRSPEELAYTQYLSQRPTAPGEVTSKGVGAGGLQDWLTGGPQRGMLGDFGASLVSPLSLLGGGIGQAATLGVFGQQSHKARQRAAAAAAQNQAAQAQYQQQLAAWQARGGPLQQAAQASTAGMGGPGSAYSQFGGFQHQFDPNALLSDPSYQFRLSQGLTGVGASAAQAGRAYSPATTQALTRYGQDYASQEYQNAWAREQQIKQQQLNALMGMSGLGQQTGVSLGGMGAGAAGATSNLLTQIANAQAAGTVGATNALTGTMGNVGNYLMMQQLMGQQTAQPSSYSQSYIGPLGYAPQME